MRTSTSAPVRALQWLLERVTIPIGQENFRRRPIVQVRDQGFAIEQQERFKLGIVERLTARKPEIIERHLPGSPGVHYRVSPERGCSPPAPTTKGTSAAATRGKFLASWPPPGCCPPAPPNVMHNAGAAGEAALAELESSPLWPTLPAVRTGRVVKLNS